MRTASLQTIEALDERLERLIDNRKGLVYNPNSERDHSKSTYQEN